MTKLDKKYILRLDTKNSIFNTTPVFSLSDNETSDFYIKVSNSNNIINVENIIAVMVAIDPNGVSHTDFIDIEKADEGLLYCNLKQELRNVPGTWKARLMLVFGEEKVVTNIFGYKVNSDEFVALNEEVIADDRYPLLTEMLSKLSNIEITELDRIRNEDNRVLAEKLREEAKKQMVDSITKLVTDTKKDINDYKQLKDTDIDTSLNNYEENTTQAIATYLNDYVTTKDTEINNNLNSYKEDTNVELERYKNTKDLEIKKVLNDNINSKNVEFDENIKTKNKQIDDKLIEVDESEKLREAAEQQRVTDHQVRETFLNGFEDNLLQIETEFNNVIANVTNGNESVTNSEIVASRGGNKSLKERLDKTDSQLETKANKTETHNIQQQVNNLVLGAVGDGNNAEVIQARGDFNVINDRFEHNEKYINNVYDIENKVNLFGSYVTGYYVEASTGVLKANASTSTTDFIECNKISDYIYTYVGKVATHQMAFYDINKKYISGKTTNTIGEWVIGIPKNAYYCRISFYNENINVFYINGISKIKKYIDKNDIYITNELLGGETLNLVDPNKSVDGGFYGAGYNNDTLGSWITSATISQTEFISVEGYTNIKITIPKAVTNLTHQWVFKNSSGTIYKGGWRQATTLLDVDVEVELEIPTDAVSFSSAYKTTNPIQINLIKKGIKDRVEILESGSGISKTLKGKKLGIIGDSISTYNGYIQSGYAHFYPRGDVQTVENTWWKKLINETGMELCVNCSWSGSTISGDTDSTTNAYSGASEKRVNDLTKSDGAKPDIIIVYISINDFGKSNNITTGSKVGNEPITQSGTLSIISDSYVLLIKKLMTKYPNAKIYCTTVMSEQFASEMPGSFANGYPNINPNDNVTLPSWNNMIRQIASNIGCGIIDMAKCGINYFNLDSYTIDKLHPNILGHELMFRQALKDMN